MEEINQSRSDDELKEAIQVVEKEIVKTDFQNPTLFLQLPTIREGLKELLSIRECMKGIDKDVFVTNEDIKEPKPPALTDEYEHSI